MDDIEKGFSLLVRKMEEGYGKEEELTREIRENEAKLLERMAESCIPIIRRIGLNVMEKGKREPDGKMYDDVYYDKKMIVLGTTEPIAYRPDDVTKKVNNQLCVLSEDGKFFEVMYTSDGFLVDSYLNSITPDEALDIYGYEIMFMLYRAMRDYLEHEEELVEALGKTLEFVFGKGQESSAT